MLGNTIYTPTTSINLKMQAGDTTTSYLWDNNIYISGRSGSPIFTIDSASGLNLSGWRQRTKLDVHSRVIRNASLRPDGVEVFVRPNRYESGRGHIIVFNWDRNNSVSVDIASLRLEVGAYYEVKDAQNYFGPPVARGTYDGKPITLPMSLSALPLPVGNVERVPNHTAPEFIAFIVQRSQKAGKRLS
jgi:hypothetical protein